jgi:site-specific recombinase XerD
MRIAEVNLPNIHHFTDHLGRKRYRVRKYVNGKRKYLGELPVDSDPNSPEFLAAYHAIMRGERPADALAGVAARGGSDTVANAISQYLDSTTFREDADSTQALRRPMLNSVQRLVGTLPLAKMDRTWIERWLEQASTKNVQRTRYLAIRAFLKWAHEAVHLIAVNPTDGMQIKGGTIKGHHTWTDAEIAQYRAHHALGTMARLALELMLTLAARRGDAVMLGKQHLKNGWLSYVQTKNKKRKPVTVEIPVPPELAAAIAACPSPDTSLAFVVNQWGRPFTASSFGKWFRVQTDAAGLPERCVPHGLRKGGSRIMAESDCTPHEIMAVTGHTTLKEVKRYTDAYDRKKAAARALTKVAKAASDNADASNVVPFAVTGT